MKAETCLDIATCASLRVHAAVKPKDHLVYQARSWFVINLKGFFALGPKSPSFIRSGNIGQGQYNDRLMICK